MLAPFSGLSFPFESRYIIEIDLGFASLGIESALITIDAWFNPSK